MVGNSITSAPRIRSRSASGDASARARVTTTRRPNKGRRSNQARSRPATAPMTMAAGGSSAVVPRQSRVVRTVVCSGRVPQRTAMTGVVGARPPAMRRAAMMARWATPMRTITVPPAAASAAQLVSRSTAWRECPVTTVNEVDRPLCVTGTPA